MSDPASVQDRLSGLSREQRALLFEQIRKRKEKERAEVAPDRIPRRLPALDPPPLSFAQERLWFIDRLQPGLTAYNIPMALRILGRVSPAVLAAILGEVMRRHEALRTTFHEAAGRPVQVISPADGWTLPLVDLAALPGEVRRTEARRLAQEEADRPFDLALGPLLRAALLRLGAAEHALLLDMHHIVSDGWSMGVLVREITTLYGAAVSGAPSPLPELPIQYADFAVWQRGWLQGEVLQRQISYWREKLAGVPAALDLPTDRPRPAAPTYRGARLRVPLDAGFARELGLLARRHEATPFMVLLAGFQALLARMTGQEDLTVGSPIANRTRAEIEPLIGFFVNTLVLRGDLTGDPSFRELLARVRRTTLEAYVHQDLPFEHLVEELRPERHLAVNPLFQVLFALQNAPVGRVELPGLSLAPLEFAVTTAQFDLELSFWDSGDGMVAEIAYSTELFDAPTPRRLAAHLEALLRAAMADAGCRLSEAPLLSAGERHQVISEWNDTGRDLADVACVHEIVERQAVLTPEAIAVEHGDEPLTYRDLMERARRLAAVLRAAGVGPDVPVGLWTGRSLALPVGVLAILEAGGACVPLDLSYPAERLALMIGDAGLRLVVAEEAALAGLPPGLLDGLEVVVVDRREDLASSSPAAALPPGPDNLVYVLYTSGSTGRPKGVALPHRTLVNLIAWAGEARPARGLRVLQFSPISFDVSFQEMFSTWASGGTLVLIPEEMRRDPAALLTFLVERRIERLFQPFVALQQLAEVCREQGRVPEGLRELITAGEQLRVTEAVAGLFRRGARLFNEYGPTETHVTTVFRLLGEPGSWPALPPIGGPIANHRIHLLDRGLRPVPVGVPGELCVGGAGLARGYLGRPDLTAERFIPDPCGPELGGRLYRTGDLARWTGGGELEYLGRIDHQVKIRGYRVEPGEIETVLAAHPGVREAVVAVRQDPPGGRRLVAYVIWDGAGAPEAELREALKACLPAPMVPSAFVALPSLPLTPSGKVDRRALAGPAFAPAGAALAERVEPATETEREMAAIWREVLGLDQVGAGDDFFDLGGHSLLAVQVLSRVRGRLGVDLPVRVLFEAPTLAGLARRADAAWRETGALPPLLERRGSREAPPSFAQARLWFLDQLEPGNPAHNLPLALHVQGQLSPAVVEAVLGEVVRRHEALRTTFEERDGQPVQVIAPADRWTLPVVDLAALPGHTGAAEVRCLAREEAARPFDLTRGPLFRAALVVLAASEHALLITLHHIVSDGWSMGVLLREFAALYPAVLAGRPSPLPELPIQYADFSLWQRSWLQGEELERQISYWRERLAGAPALLELPTDRPRPAVPSFRGSRLLTAFDPALSRELARLAQRREATLFMVLLAGFQALLYSITGQEDLPVGSPIANRNRAEIEPLIGLFVNTLVLRGDVSGDPPFRELLARVRQTTLESYAHQDLPFERLVEEVQPERQLSANPLFQVLFALQNTPMGDLGLPGLALAPIDVGAMAAQFDLELSLWEEGDTLRVLALYSADLFDAPMVQRLVSRFQLLLQGAVADDGRRLSDLPLLPAAERAQILREWNDTGRDDDFGFAPLHRLVERQAAAAPEAVAVLSREGSLSYGDLNARADRLARRLRSLGVGLEDRVAVAAGRCLAMPVALLAVLKAGAAYVPLDPAYPAERLSLMLADSGASVLLIQRQLLARGLLAGSLARTLFLDGDEGPPAADSQAPLETVGDPESMAYVIYTSGSTGSPKGVAVPHRAVCRFVRAVAQLYRLGPGDRLLQFASISFDNSVEEIWATLAAGATLVLRPEGMMDSIPRFVGELERWGVTLMSLPTPVWHEVVGGLEEEGRLSLPPSLRLVVIGGDEAQASALAAWRRRAGPPITLYNSYGPTETTVACTFVDVEGWREGEAIPIGRPLAGSRVHVAAPDLAPAPIGSWGELVIGGAVVARGYLGRPDLTAERYVPDPWSGEPGARVYRSGDRFRFRGDGQLLFGGRFDRQVKVRGFRVEPGEVEAALTGHPEVAAAAVLGRRDPAGRKSLVAYIVPAGGEEGPGAGELRRFLGERLPSHMIPAAFVSLPELPRTPSGKIDRRALAYVQPAAPAAGAFAAPRTPLEESLAGLWAAVLGRERVGRDDNFFDLGGHSLVATRLLSRIKAALGVEIPLRAIFEAPTVAEMAHWFVAPALADGTSLKTRPLALAPWREGEPAPPSFGQERLWFIDQLMPGSTAFNMPSPLLLRGPLDPGVLERAFQEVRRRQGSLRTRFEERNGVPVQVVDPPGPWRLSRVALDALPAPLRRREAERLAREDASRPFDLRRGPLFRPFLVRLGASEHALLLTCHHIVSDGWSANVLIRELTEHYAAFAAGEPPPLPEPPVQYAGFSIWQRERLAGPALEAQLAYWRENLAAAPPLLDLPLDRPRPALQTYRGEQVLLRLPADLLAVLQAVSVAETASLYMTLLAGLALLLHRWSGQEEVVVGSPVAGREQRETEGLIGLFLNLLPMRVDLAGRPTFRELLRRARRTALEAYARQDVPFERMLQELRLERNPSHTPVFQVLLNMLNLPPVGGEIPGGISVEPLDLEEIESKYDFTLYAAEGEDGLFLNLVYNPDLFDHGRMAELLRQYRAVLEQAARDPDRAVESLSLLTPEAAALLPDLARPLPAAWPGAAHERFLGRARRHPDRPAVMDLHGAWTWGDLDAASGRLAARLLAAGTAPGEPVAVWAHRAAPLAAALLGVLRAGAAFVVLDPAYPPARLAAIMGRCRPRAWVEVPGAAPVPREVKTLLDGALHLRVAAPGAPVDPGAPCAAVAPDAPAWVAFTSGSMGEPKGIVGSHRPLSHFLDWHESTFGLGEADRFSLLSGLAHDPLLRDVFTPLWVGGELRVPDPEGMGEPGWLAGWFARERISVAHLTPALARLLAGEGETPPLSALRLVCSGGDALTSDDVARLRRTAPRALLINFYGATETPQAMGWKVLEEDRFRVPLGRGIDGVDLAVLGHGGGLAGVGEVGEICVRTPYLALGYLGDPAATAERFAPAAGGRLYRTGDLGRYEPDGDVTFAGRADLQVKVRGFRIELGEIEAALASHPRIREAAVILQGSGEDRFLAAYLVPAEGRVPDWSELRTFLAARLPAWMIPAAWTELESLPLTPNGKVDRQALARREPQRTHGGVTPPSTPAELRMADLWREVLGVEQVGVEDNFFDLGGHSLLATQLVSRVRAAFGVDLPLRRLFERPTLGALAADLEAAAPASLAAIPRRPPGLDPVPASFAQERLWFLHRLNPADTAYNISKALSLLGELSPAALEGALGEVVRRHETLRTTFQERGGQPVQVIAPPGQWSLPLADLAGLPAAACSAEVRRLAEEDAWRPFDLARGPLMRAVLLRLGGCEHALILTLHHVISDGWSTGVLVDEITALYGAALAGEPSPLPELPIQYADFAVWQRRWMRGEVLERQLEYWRNRLAGAPETLVLATDRPRSAAPAAPGARFDLRIGPEVARELSALSRRHDATLFMTLLAGFHALLVRHTGQEDLVVGTAIANRNRAEIEPLIGFFVNALALRPGLPGDPEFLSLLASARRTALEAYAHQDLPFERLVEELRPDRHLARNPLFQVTVGLYNTPLGAAGLSGLTLAPVEYQAPVAVFDLELHFSVMEDGLWAAFDYRTDLFDAATIRRLACHLGTLLAGIVEDPGRRLSELPLLPAAERHQLLREWNDTLREEAGFRGVAGLIEEQARRLPGALAVSCEGRRLTYGELDSRAERLAHRLRSLGVGPEVPVGLYVERSPEMVIGALAVLKAGGAYVPLDPAYPHNRLALIVAETRMPVLLSRAGMDAAWAGGIPVVPLNGDLPADPRPTQLPAGLLPDHPAYVIYTSGSTGRPKGVPISQASLLNMVQFFTRTFGLSGRDRVLQVAAPGFDATVGDLWPTLASGASLQIVDEETRMVPERLLGWLTAEGITFGTLPTPLGERLLDLLEEGLPPGLVLRTLILGGDRLRRFPSPSLPFSVVNGYGPTESTMIATWEVVGEPELHRLPAIGRPIDNTQLYVVDRHLGPVPLGAPGELALGGAGLSRGYLHRPELAARSFVPDPFSGRPGERLYLTGDRVRYRPDGRLDFLERIDAQVKVRGFRIELGEIESVLARHLRVREAIVTAYEEEGREAVGPRLAAFVVPAGDGGPAEELAHVAEWQTLYEDAYSLAGPEETPDEPVDPIFDIRGWNSSYTGGPIPAGEMREWVERTVERILALRPRRVLEVGCGTGLLLFRVAPATERYRATDFSTVALDGIRRQLGRPGCGLPQVELRQALAHDWEEVPPGEADLVVLNSVVQYFPGVDYLVRVLEGAVRAVAPGGAVFLGDVRSLPLLPALHASVELFQASDAMPVAELRRRIGRRMTDEEELAVDPQFFFALARHLPAIRRVDLLVKRGRWHNELTRFRYDVVLHVGEAPTAAAGSRLDARDHDLSPAALERLLAGMPAAVELASLPNARLAGEAAALDLLASRGGEAATAGELRRAIAERAARGIDPEDLWLLGDRHSYDVELTVDPDAPFRFGAVLRRRGSAATAVTATPAVPAAPDLPWSAFANDPLAAKLARRLVPELRRHLQAELPDYMVPGSIVLLDHLPLTAHGKVDRSALPKPELLRPAGGAAPPRTPVERTLTDVWREVLGLEEIGREDGFFELGGHSLLATQLVSRVREAFAVELPLRVIFEAPTIAGLAAWIEQASGQPSAAPLLRPVSHDRPLQLSFAQERLWFLDRLRPGNPAYNMPTALRAHGELSPALLEAVLGEVVRRHEALRTTFQLHDGQPAQVIAPPRPWALPLVDLSGLPEDMGLAAARHLAAEEAARPFDLEQGPLLRAALLRLGPAGHALLLTLHHIVSDGWSMGVLVREIAALYGAALAGRPSPLPELPIQYADFAAWQRGWLTGDELERQLSYWRQRLAGAPASLDLPYDRPRPATPTHHGGRVTAVWDPDLSRQLARLALSHEVTLFMVLLSGFQTLLGRLAGQQDVPVGSPIANRNRVEIEPLIGFFVNTLVLRGDLSGDPPFRELLARVRSTTLEAYAHQDLPFEQLVEALRPQRTLAMNPLFQVMFALQNTPAQAAELPGLSFAPLEFERAAARFDLELGLWEVGDSLMLDLVYSAELFDAPTAQRAAVALETLLRGMLADDGRPLSELPLLPAAARHQIVTEWNDTRPASAPRNIVERFAAQAAATPDAVALEAGGERLTYADLDRRANRLAHRLRRLGVGPEVAVGLLVERTPEVAAGILGIWKAGGAYLPLDPGQPRERLAYLLEDSRVPVVAVGAGLAAALPPQEARLVRLDDEDLASESDLPPPGLPRPSDLAYLIYTSGTTGKPKAVLVEHGSLASILAAEQEAFAFRPGDRVPSVASFSFDIFLMELLGPLLRGGTCVLLPLRPTLDLARLAGELGSATILLTVPAVMRQVLELARRGAAAPRLRALFLGGDAVPADLLADLRATFPQAELWVAYGPTEAAIVCTRWQVPAARPVRTLIGRPFAGAEIQVCDAGGRPVPIGVPGEIWIGGAVVARGYWRRQELTAEKFVTVAGRRFFRSGDLARQRPDGTLEFLGRLDHQVKIRGFRIELGEIEAALADQPGVREAVVLARDDGRGGERRLVAYVVAGPEAAPEAAALRAALARRLPAYMLPAAFVFLDALPLNAGGKIDREALPPPQEDESAAGQPGEPPRTPLERFLAGQFRDVLGLPADREIGRHDDFFDLGGTSITGALLIHRLQEALATTVHVVAIFDHPTVASLADYLGEQHAGAAESLPGRGVLVPLQKGSPDHRPLFCIHPVGGEVVAYRELAHRLGPGQPVYGLQAPDPPIEDLREMAARYLAAVREIQPEGPYRLAGWSLGGVVAYEMARQLAEQGQRAEVLALIDSRAPVPGAGEPEGAERVMLFAIDLARLQGLQVPPVDLSGLDEDGALTVVLELGRQAGLLPPSAGLPELRRLFDRFRANRRALATYEPRPYDGEVQLFRAAERAARMEEQDPTLGWSALVNGRLRINDLPGDHYTILRQEVGTLAGRLREMLGEPGHQCPG